MKHLVIGLPVLPVVVIRSGHKPTLCQLMSLRTSRGEKIFTTLSPQWHDIGILMDFDDDGHTLDVIVANNIKIGVEACCKEMFQLWLCGLARVEPTWMNLLKILNDCQMTTLANDIRKALPVCPPFNVFKESACGLDSLILPNDFILSRMMQFGLFTLLLSPLLPRTH